MLYFNTLFTLYVLLNLYLVIENKKIRKENLSYNERMLDVNKTSVAILLRKDFINWALEQKEMSAAYRRDSIQSAIQRLEELRDSIPTEKENAQ